MGALNFNGERSEVTFDCDINCGTHVRVVVKTEEPTKAIEEFYQFIRSLDNKLSDNMPQIGTVETSKKKQNVTFPYELQSASDSYVDSVIADCNPDQIETVKNSIKTDYFQGVAFMAKTFLDEIESDTSISDLKELCIEAVKEVESEL